MKVSKSGNAYGNYQEIGGGGHEHTYGPKVTGSDQVNGVGQAYVATSNGYDYSTTGGGGHSHGFTPSVSDNISVSISSNDSETRPINYTIRIWKRIN